ncbi:hypothetical protein [Pseudoalteromonas sp. SSDWG2]|uniref:hypothetical protein n=1 Tax=Pseudoalteromonas sp. SSDWG2 TaxID=3139391 RepID=UPI003BA98FF7
MLHSQFSVPVVLAACIPAFIGTLLPFDEKYEAHPQAAIYAGTFAGMCSAHLITGYWQLVVLSLIGTILYALSMNLFKGFGGKLGGVAFVSVALLMLTRGGLW